MQKEEAYRKMTRFCVYRDRCHQEVRSKLLKMGIYGAILEEIMGDLVTEGYLDEERFARSFARGKHRMKQWGRNRILNELRLRKISAYCIKKAMEELDQEEYLEMLRKLARQYVDRRRTQYEKQVLYKKAYNYLFRKGYENELITLVLAELRNAG